MIKYTDEEILRTSRLGIEFEYFTKLKGRNLTRSLEKALGKKVVIPYEVSGFNKKDVKAKPKEKPDRDKFILTPDYSGGPDMQELITGPLPYEEARIILIKVLKWINENGWTTDKCGIHLNISFIPELHLLKRFDIMTMDRLKFCLSFDESIVFKHFPKREGNVYAATMKTIIPANPFTYTDSFKIVSPNSFMTPNTKYFGVNFLKQEKNYLEFRYLGGADYDKKIQSILDLYDNFTLQLFRIMQNQEYSQTDIVQLKKIISKHKKIVEGFSSYSNFVYNFPNIALMVDLNSDQQVVLTFWNTLRLALYNLVVFGHMDKGIINYDTDMSKIQIRDSKITKASEIRNYEIFNTYIDGMLYDCDLYNCTITSSHLNNCVLVKGNLVEDSKVSKTPIQYSNKLKTCYIDNDKTLINGKLEACIIRNGDVSQLAVLDKDCVIVKT